MDRREYRRLAREHFGRLAHTDVLTVSERRAPLLARVIERPSNPAPGRSVRMDELAAQRPISELLRDMEMRTVLVAKPGSGKTTSLLQHALALASAEDGPLPVFVPLRELDGGYADLEALIVQCMGRVAPGVRSDLRDGPWLLLLDGVNERAGVGDPFTRLTANYPTVQMLFTTRDPAFHLGQQIELLPLSPADRDTLIDAWIPDEAAALQRRVASDRRLDELSRTPLFLALLCDAAREGLAPGSTRGALIRASVDRHARRYEAKAGPEGFDAARINGWLAALAHAMLRRGTLQIQELGAEEVLRAAPGAPPDPRTLLRHLTGFHLLARRAPGLVEFVHPLVHEFYAAQHLRELRVWPDRRTLIREYINHTLWTEPLRLFAEECDDPARAEYLVDVTREVDEMLAARLVGNFPPSMQPSMLRRLRHEDDVPGTRLTRAIAVGTIAAIDELQQLAKHPNPDVRFQVADSLWDFSGPQIAALNASLLADVSLSVVAAAADNLRRHVAPVDVLLAALGREDTWARPSDTPVRLVVALLQSDTPEAAARACELVRTHFGSARDDLPAPAQELFTSVRRALSSAVLAPSVARALAGLLSELDGHWARHLLRVLSHSTDVVDLEPALAGLPQDRRNQVVEWSLKFAGRFKVSDARLLEAVQQRPLFSRFASTSQLFAAAAARRCRGLVPWLAQLVAGEILEMGLYLGGYALGPLLALDPAEAVHAATRALTTAVPEIRRSNVVALCTNRSPALADLRSRAMTIACADMDLAEHLVRSPDKELAAEVLEAVLDQQGPGVRRVIQAFWQRWDVTAFIAQVREQDRHHLQWPAQMAAPLRRALTRSLLGPVDLALTDAFLDSELWRDMHPIVVPYLEHVVDTADREAVTRALRHLYGTAWRPSLPTFVRLLADGHSGYAMRRPDADPDALYVGLRPLLRHADATTRKWALASMYPLPLGYLGEFVALLDEPEFALSVAYRLVSARLYAEFPAVLRRPGLVVVRGPDEPIAAFDAESLIGQVDLPPIEWPVLQQAIVDAPVEIVRQCVAILATREDQAWDQPFLQLFMLAPAFHYHPRILACLCNPDASEADDALDPLIRCAETEEELALLDSWHDVAKLSRFSVARAFAEAAPPKAAPLVLQRLSRLVDSHDESMFAVVARYSLAGWWGRLLAQVGTAAHAAQLGDLARRTSDVWLSQTLYRTAAEIQQRTGIYHPRHTTMLRPWVLLHLSDLHFSAEDQPERWHSALAEDLRRELRVDCLDAVVLSGDIVDRARVSGYAGAERFIATICEEFRVPRARVVIVPGNHDVDRNVAAPAIQRVARGRGKKPPAHDFEVRGKRYAITDRAIYERRLAAFAEFFTRALDRPYPLDPREQARLWIWPELEVVVLGLSSVGEIDGVRPGHATIDDTALGRALEPLRREPNDYLKIAVFHHPIHSPGEDRLYDSQFLDRLAVAGFSLVLHGHVHQADNTQFRYDRSAKGRRIEVVGAGTFGAQSSELPTGYPWQYNLLRFEGDQVRVETRRREADNTSWKPYACWTTGPGEAPQAWYSLDLSRR